MSAPEGGHFWVTDRLYDTKRVTSAEQGVYVLVARHESKGGYDFTHGQMAGKLSGSRRRVQQHLAVLKAFNMVAWKRSGKQRGGNVYTALPPDVWDPLVFEPLPIGNGLPHGNRLPIGTGLPHGNGLRLPHGNPLRTPGSKAPGIKTTALPATQVVRGESADAASSPPALAPPGSSHDRGAASPHGAKRRADILSESVEVQATAQLQATAPGPVASYYVGSQSEFDTFMATFAPAFDALAPPTDREPADEDSEVGCVAVYPGWGRCPALDTERWVGPALHRVLCIRHRQVVDPKFGTRVGEPGAELLRPDQLTPQWRPLSGGDGFGMNPGVWTCEPEATP